MVRKMTGGIVDRFLSSAKAEMIQKNETEIRCPCRRCKLKCLLDPDSETIKGHLLTRGFMDGYRWQGDEEDYEFVHGGQATVSRNSAEGRREDEESPGHDHDAGHNHHVEDAGHDHEEDQDEGHDHHEDEDAGEDGDGPSSMDWVQDPHLQELLLNQASNNARAAAREKAKLNQLEIDAVTPLYEGCRPEDTRLKVALMALEMKVKHKMTDACFDENMSFWHQRLRRGTSARPVSRRRRKSCVLWIYRT